MKRQSLYKVGDRVVTTHELSGTVVAVHIGYKIMVDDGSIIEFTPEHLVKSEKDGKSKD